MKVALVSLGCPKNLVDSEKILGALGASGVCLTTLPRDSDIIIINTCGFIKPAIDETEEEIDKALQIAGNNKKVYVYGCAVNRFGRELRHKYPEISGWFRLEQKDKLLKEIRTDAVNVESRLLSTHGYAYLKIADGCSNHCSYCAIPMIKGGYHSVEMDELLKEAVELAKLGVRELILIAQDTTRYGLDIYNRSMLSPLIKEISKIPEIEWIRIMYAHPKTINDEIISEIRSNDKVCKYIDLPIQHVNNRLLQMMNRGYDRKRLENVINRLLNIKGISIRTTIITGFPTETNVEFEELIRFIKEWNPDWLGVFPFFGEPGTKAAGFKPLVDSTVDQRFKKAIALQKKLIRSKITSRIGKVFRTLLHRQNGQYIGHTEFICPTIDADVLIKTKNLKIGQFYKATITGAKGTDIYATTE